MSDAFQHFPLHTHSQIWFKKLRNTESSLCPGKDPEDTKCTCPDIVYATRVRIRDGATFNAYIYCGCCDLPIFPEADPSV